jgi:hypothetical protein
VDVSALEPRRWYASQRHARLDVDGPKVVLYDSWERNARGHMRSVWRLACWSRTGNTVENAMPTPIVVTGRTMAHVDRLARDFLAHGVSPTKTGGRGVMQPWRPGAVWSQVVDAMERYERAEARATRVVSR